ncbi:hypothetical protein VTK26DRAFT_9028 [Humicola hyalothermophila]
MPSVVSLGLVGLLAVQGACSSLREGWELGQFIKQERTIALQGVLNNIGPNGSMSPAQGAVWSSPVRPRKTRIVSDPTHTCMQRLVDSRRLLQLDARCRPDSAHPNCEFLLGNKALQPVIEDYIYSQAIIQTVSSPSGSLLPHGLDLGESKYLANGSRFNGNSGRTQQAGPPLRAAALIQYSNYLISEGKRDRVRKEIWPIITNDLSYVGQYWNLTGSDLWEEVSGYSFFTTQNQYRSLGEGAALAKSLEEPCAACHNGPGILCFLQSYWNGKSYTANFITGDHNHSGVDASTILGPIAAFDPWVPCDSPTLQPCHPRSLADFKVFVDTFRNSSVYPINAGIPQNMGIALGRYPEDVYFNGNPWYLIVHGAAEFLYDVLISWSKAGSITIDATSLPFFRDLYPPARVGRYAWYHPSFWIIQLRVRSYADSFVAVAKKYTPADGMLSEQFLKTEPFTPTSAANLTLSFASFISMTHRRDGHLPARWVPSGQDAPAVSAQCTAGSVPGVYAAS